jgi:outer membrane protein assembly factor BamA
MPITLRLQAKAFALAVPFLLVLFVSISQAQTIDTPAQPVVAKLTGGEPTPTPTPQTTNNLADRVKSYDRNAPRRENLTGIKIVKHVNGLFGGFEQGAGFGFGVELTTADSIPGIELRARALTSTKFYRKGEIGLNIPELVSEKSHAEVYFTYLRRTKDNFFGIGPRTPDNFATNFDLEQRSITGALNFDFSKRLLGGVYVRHANTATYRGKDDNDPPVDLLFTGNPNTPEPLRFAPGLRTNISIVSFGGYVEFNGRNDERGLTRGGYFYGRLSGNTGTGDRSQGYGWTEVELDGRAYIPLGSHRTSLALRAYTDLKKPYDDDDLIPFYDLSFLGGRSFVRGFKNFRFRANSLLLFSTELRQTVWKQKETRGVDIIGFGDGGQVWGDHRPNLPPAFRGNDEFNSSNWRFCAGFGVQYRYNKDFAVRLDYARSNERSMTYFSVSRGF